MGTGNGVIISVPLNPPAALSKTLDSHKPIDDAMRKKSVPGDIVRVYTDSHENVTAESFIPYCNMSQAQLSFHGHRDAVKFFVSVPGEWSIKHWDLPLAKEIYCIFLIEVMVDWP